MIKELPHERGTGRVGRVVGVVPAQVGVDDEVDRCLLAAVAELVQGVQHAFPLPDVSESLLETRAVFPEEGLDSGEHPAETILADHEPAAGWRLSPEAARQPRGDRRGGRGCEESAPIKRAGLTGPD